MSTQKSEYPGVLRCNSTFTVIAVVVLLVSCSGINIPAHAATLPEPPAPAPDLAPRPNILLIMVDDLGFNDLAINNHNRDIDTPNLDALAREGVRFTRHYAMAVCSPARAALLTGLYPSRLGYQPDGGGLSPERLTLPERLREVGYVTWHLGKWHLGDLRRGAWPDRQGFDHWLGFLNQWRLAGSQHKGAVTLAKPRYENPWLQGDSEPGRHFKGHLESILTAKAIDVLTELHGEKQPWFINLWYYAPHAPVSPAPAFASRYPDTPAGRYRAHVNQLDHNIGTLLDHLESIGARDNTIVVVVSDNGGTNRQLDNNAPYVGRKGQLAEGGLRTPLLVRWPDTTRNGQVVDSTVAIQDIYPTLLEAVGAAVPAGLDGVSFYAGYPVATRGEGRALFWEDSLGYSMLSADGRWRLVQPVRIPGIESAARLYDLHKDPSGGQPLASPPDDILAAMQRELGSWYLDVHRLQLQKRELEDGRLAVTGDRFQRTPGIGGFTLGMGVRGDQQGRLLEQPGTWSVERRGRRIRVLFGEHVLLGDIPGTSDCHELVISGLFRRRISTFSAADQLQLDLYIDRQLAGTLMADGAIASGDNDAPTLVIPYRDAADGTPQPPVLLNVPVQESLFVSPESLGKLLCGAG